MTGKTKTAVTVTGLAVVGGVGYYLYKRHREAAETEGPSFETGQQQQPEQVAGGTGGGGGGGGGGASVEPIASTKAEAAPAPEKTGVNPRPSTASIFGGPFAAAGITGSTGTRTGPVHGEPVILHPLEGRAHGGEHVVTGHVAGEPRQAERVRVNRTEGSRYPIAQPKRGRR